MKRFHALWFRAVTLTNRMCRMPALCYSDEALIKGLWADSCSAVCFDLQSNNPLCSVFFTQTHLSCTQKVTPAHPSVNSIEELLLRHVEYHIEEWNNITFVWDLYYVVWGFCSQAPCMCLCDSSDQTYSNKGLSSGSIANTSMDKPNVFFFWSIVMSSWTL